MLLCIRQNIKSDKYELTGKEKVSLQRSARTHTPPDHLVEET